MQKSQQYLATGRSLHVTRGPHLLPAKTTLGRASVLDVLLGGGSDGTLQLRSIAHINVLEGNVVIIADITLDAEELPRSGFHDVQTGSKVHKDG
jgi:hypothetical protein